jgi:hypothetical protein
MIPPTPGPLKVVVPLSSLFSDVKVKRMVESGTISGSEGRTVTNLSDAAFVHFIPGTVPRTGSMLFQVQKKSGTRAATTMAASAFNLN